mmetsp:Transcript_47726/g.91213  ORF Transcript_47726/g.91213 Transcript_47726/m.91213 type:complete len:255 (-) Transcript_47726:104-868(-)
MRSNTKLWSRSLEGSSWSCVSVRVSPLAPDHVSQHSSRSSSVMAGLMRMETRTAPASSTLPWPCLVARPRRRTSASSAGLSSPRSTQPSDLPRCACRFFSTEEALAMASMGLDVERTDIMGDGKGEAASPSCCPSLRTSSWSSISGNGGVASSFTRGGVDAGRRSDSEALVADDADARALSTLGLTTPLFDAACISSKTKRRPQSTAKTLISAQRVWSRQRAPSPGGPPASAFYASRMLRLHSISTPIFIKENT